MCGLFWQSVRQPNTYTMCSWTLSLSLSYREYIWESFPHILFFSPLSKPFFSFLYNYIVCIYIYISFSNTDSTSLCPKILPHQSTMNDTLVDNVNGQQQLLTDSIQHLSIQHQVPLSLLLLLLILFSFQILFVSRENRVRKDRANHVIVSLFGLIDCWIGSVLPWIDCFGIWCAVSEGNA